MKRGSSHVEMILSFVIFMVAIGFALYFFRPGGDRLVESSFSYLFREIEENSSTKVLVYSVKIYNGTIYDNIIAFNFSGADSGFNPKIYTENGENFDAKRTGEIVYGSSTNWNNIDFITIVLSDEFENSSIGSAAVNESIYSISSSVGKKVLSENKLNNLSSYYVSNYTELKKDFNIPGRVNFGFDVKLSDLEILAEREIPESLEVFIEKKKVEVLRENGEIEFADLTIKVW